MRLYDSLNEATRFASEVEAFRAGEKREGFTFDVCPIKQIGSFGVRLDFRAEAHPTRYTVRFNDGMYA